MTISVVWLYNCPHSENVIGNNEKPIQGMNNIAKTMTLLILFHCIIFSLSKDKV
ncbi:hypothetical protein XBJ1_1991 [Xenorhabdus bovienii SS-2004]|uniref:Uncharacterized protein n=1 Tax=Xenorhabdus bovienii (strain SS-2004) TaxID=406818 RepID=D3V302_XENBS|nr:hypothetical protein XBJ1_1991 [Xenorhabdus bovienii SS-2004]